MSWICYFESFVVAALVLNNDCSFTLTQMSSIKNSLNITLKFRIRGRVYAWVPEEPRRIGRPNITLRIIIQDDTGLEGKSLTTAMQDRDSWRKNFVQRFT